MIPEVNLLPQRDVTETKNRWLVIGGLLLWLVLLIMLIVQYVIANNDLKLANSRIVSLESEQVLLEKQLDVQQLSEDAFTLREAVEYVEQLTVPTSIIIEELIEFLPDRSYLTGYSYSNGELSIQVEFESFNRIAEYIADIKTSPLFRDIQVSAITIEDLIESGEEEEVTDFSIVPRYHVDFSLQINMAQLAERGKDDE